MSLETAILVSLVWGIFMLTVLSYFIARTEGKSPWGIIGEHVLIAVVVIFITHYVGDWVATLGA